MGGCEPADVCKDIVFNGSSVMKENEFYQRESLVADMKLRQDGRDKGKF